MKETLDDTSIGTGKVSEVKSPTYIAPSREGKLHISAWLSPEYKMRMRSIQAQHPEKSLQELYAEALNDLYVKYGLPIVVE